MIKYVYEIGYPFGEKRKYLEWVRSISDTLQAPGELRHAARYFGRKEISRIFQSELLAHGTNIGIKVLSLRGDYSKNAVAGTTSAGEDQA